MPFSRGYSFNGAHSRLNRFENEGEHAFSDEARGLEELVAELGSAMLLAECGIFEETAEKNASYCQHWINQLKADQKLIVRAAGRAQKAVDFILGRSYDKGEHSAETETTEGAPVAPTPEPITPTPEPTPVEPTPPPEPMPLPAESEPTEPEPEPSPVAGRLILGDFVDDSSILRSIDFVAHTATLEFPSVPRAWDDKTSYHNLISTFKVVPITKLVEAATAAA